MRWTFILGIILIVIGIILISIPFISNAIKENSINQTNRNIFIIIGVISFVVGIFIIIIGFYTKRLGSNKSKTNSISSNEIIELNNEFNFNLKLKFEFTDNQLIYVYKNFSDEELMLVFYTIDVKTDEIPEISILRPNINKIKSKYQNFISTSKNTLRGKLRVFNNGKLIHDDTIKSSLLRTKIYNKMHEIKHEY